MCYHWNSNTCEGFASMSTTQCNGYYVYYLVWYWSKNYCHFRVCTTSYDGLTGIPTRSPTKSPTYTPTVAPTVKCVNKYGYCAYGAFLGACHNQDLEARMSFLEDCPVSCGTCYNATVIPTNHPTIKPISSPTVFPTQKPSKEPSTTPTTDPTSGPSIAPTCIDLLPYCEFVKANCSSPNPSVQTKLMNECSLTCGGCTQHPTRSPSAPCVDAYSYCTDLAGNGACFNSDHEARTQFQIDCPVSCNTCHGKTVSPSHQPTLSPTWAPTCVDVTGYCDLLLPYCNFSSLKYKMQSDCSSTCGFCISEPIVPRACEDAYTYCEEAALAGACHNVDFEARLHFLNDCPASCNTCHNQTMTPTFSPTDSPTLLPTSPTSSPSLNPSDKPTDEPTRIPTDSPTCLDLIGYCEYVEGYCNSTQLSIQVKLQEECANTCGFCSGEEARRRLAVDEQSRISTDIVTSLVLVVFLVVISILLLRHLVGRRYGNLPLDRKDALCEVTNRKVTFSGTIAEFEGTDESASQFTCLNKDRGSRRCGGQ